ncbi:MAG: 50S ribosomal protein L10 [Candidatus Wolfebacteria bacterium]|nr:50S ribosomal protein L10 [Candidatus Wolfebacteria bacterium]
MLNKTQKKEKVSESKELLDKSKSLVFIDFGKTTVKDFEALRRSIKELGAKVKVVKKKLLAIALRDKKIDFDPEQFELQVGTVFAPNEIYEIAGPVFKSKIKILGGYDIAGKESFDAAKMKMFGQLPSREILLGQLVGMIAAPIKMFLNVLDQKSKMVENK